MIVLMLVTSMIYCLKTNTKTQWTKKWRVYADKSGNVSLYDTKAACKSQCAQGEGKTVSCENTTDFKGDQNLALQKLGQKTGGFLCYIVDTPLQVRSAKGAWGRGKFSNFYFQYRDICHSFCQTFEKKLCVKENKGHICN